MKKLALTLAALLLLTACGNTPTPTVQPTTPPPAPTTTPTPTQPSPTATAAPDDYAAKLAQLLALTAAFDPESVVGGLAANTAFNNVKAAVAALLAEPTGVVMLPADVARVDKQSGFAVTCAETVSVDGTNYRLVTLTNTHTPRIDGAVDSLFVQYWNADTFGVVPLVDSHTSSGEVTSLADARIIAAQSLISVIIKRNSDTFAYIDSYQLIAFSLEGGDIENCPPSVPDDVDNGHWQVSAQTYEFVNPDRTAHGLLVYELGDEDNAEPTRLTVNGEQLTIANTQTPSSTITLTLQDGAWTVSDNTQPLTGMAAIKAQVFAADDFMLEMSLSHKSDGTVVGESIDADTGSVDKLYQFGSDFGDTFSETYAAASDFYANEKAFEKQLRISGLIHVGDYIGEIRADGELRYFVDKGVSTFTPVSTDGNIQTVDILFTSDGGETEVVTYQFDISDPSQPKIVDFEDIYNFGEITVKEVG